MNTSDVHFTAANLLSRFYRCLDERQDEAVADLMHPEGVWHRQGKALAGRDEILLALAQRPTGRRIHHLLTNFVVADEAADGVTVTAYMAVVSSEIADDVAGPAPFQGIANVRTVHARIAPTGQGLRVLELRSLAPTFERRPG